MAVRNRGVLDVSTRAFSSAGILRIVSNRTDVKSADARDSVVEMFFGKNRLPTAVIRNRGPLDDFLLGP